MAEIWGAVIGAAVAIGTTAYSYASRPDMPKSPDLAGASREQIDAEARALPDRLRLEAAAQQGGSTNYTTTAHTEKQTKQFVSVPRPGSPPGRLGRSGMGAVRYADVVPYVASEWAEGGKYAGLGTPKIITRKVNVNIPGGSRTADFTGFGQADVQGAIAKKNAESQLALQKKYGSKFIAESLKQEALANPEGKAARDREYELIQQQEANKPDRPVAALLDQQVGDQLAAGKNLDHMSESVLRDAVASSQAARGNAVDTTDFAAPLTTGFEGEARRSAANQKALSWLTSGATPEDVQYRREQQNLSNLGAFVNGQTPQSQFQTLSGAQQGPAPFFPGQPNSTMNPNSGAAANSGAMSTWGTNLNYNMSQANPWMAGLSTILAGLNTSKSAGALSGGAKG